MRLQVFDALGREIEGLDVTQRNQGIFSINTTSWDPGMYIFKVLEDNEPVGEGKFVVLQ